MRQGCAGGTPEQGQRRNKKCTMAGGNVGMGGEEESMGRVTEGEREREQDKTIFSNF